MRLYKLIALIAFLVISGCASVANYQAELQTWVGQSEQNLEANWGNPSSITLSGNLRLITYVKNDGVYVSGGYWGRTVVPLYCTTIFSVENGVVIRAQFQGNECTAY
jgi:hypothetical protein